MPHYIFLPYTPVNVNPFQGWGDIGVISPINIESIPDTIISPDLGDSSQSASKGKVGSSIPTPLARLFSFKNALEIVTEQINNGTAVQHREEFMKSIHVGLVSDCLDFLEWFFVHGDKDFEKVSVTLKSDYKFGEGDSANLLALSDAFKNTIDHKEFFGGELRVYLFKFKGKVVGGTSPFSLLYTSPNWRRLMADINEVKDIGGLTDDRFFDNDYCLLDGRDPRFVHYLWDILKPFVNINTSPLKSFAEYVETSIDIENINLENVKYDSIRLGETLVLNNDISFNLKKCDISEDNAVQSDFLLDSNFRGAMLGAKKPIVLSSNMDMPGKYVRGKDWDKGLVDFDNPHRQVDISQRVLPNSGVLETISLHCR